MFAPAAEYSTERLVLQTVGLSHLSLGTVAVNGVVQPLLGHADEDLDGAFIRAGGYQPDGPQWKSNKRLALASAKEQVDELLTCYAFALSEIILHSLTGSVAGHPS